MEAGKTLDVGGRRFQSLVAHDATAARASWRHSQEVRIERSSRMPTNEGSALELVQLCVELGKSSPVEQHELSLRLPVEPQHFFVTESRESA